MASCKECKDCFHYELCGVFGYISPVECGFYTDRSQFVELPCEFIRKKDLIRELGAQCAVNKIDLETVHNMINHLPYFRIEAERALKERENNAE